MKLEINRSQQIIFSLSPGPLPQIHPLERKYPFPLPQEMFPPRKHPLSEKG